MNETKCPKCGKNLSDRNYYRGRVQFQDEIIEHYYCDNCKHFLEKKYAIVYKGIEVNAKTLYI